MKYRRVLYMKEYFSTELKSKLRIASYDKRRSLKRNVYYVSFASKDDMEHADRTCNDLSNITLKPFQPRSRVEFRRKQRTNIRKQRKPLASSSLRLSSSPTPFQSPTTQLTFLSDNNSSCITSQSDSSRRNDETLEERAVRILSPFIGANRDVTPLPAPNTLNSIRSTSEINLVGSRMSSNTKKKQQLIDYVQSCLNAMKTAQRAADDLCQHYRSGIDYSTALTRLCQAHSTAFYLKAATSVQINDLLLTGLRLSWPELANNINDFRTDVGREQLFIMEIASTKHILTKLDSAASIAISSKLAYQLTKLSH